jgi:hypothetical protein
MFDSLYTSPNLFPLLRMPLSTHYCNLSPLYHPAYAHESSISANTYKDPGPLTREAYLAQGYLKCHQRTACQVERRLRVPSSYIRHHFPVEHYLCVRSSCIRRRFPTITLLQNDATCLGTVRPSQ